MVKEFEEVGREFTLRFTHDDDDDDDSPRHHATVDRSRDAMTTAGEPANCVVDARTAFLTLRIHAISAHTVEASDLLTAGLPFVSSVWCKDICSHSLLVVSEQQLRCDVRFTFSYPRFSSSTATRLGSSRTQCARRSCSCPLPSAARATASSSCCRTRFGCRCWFPLLLSWRWGSFGST